MKKIANYFKRLSLTQQIILIILSFVIFFFAFFFLFLSGNIDRTISVQMYDLMDCYDFKVRQFATRQNGLF